VGSQPLPSAVDSNTSTTPQPVVESTAKSSIPVRQSPISTTPRATTPASADGNGENGNGSRISAPAPTIGARSEDALKRHQERMAKKRELAALEKERQYMV